MRAVHPVHPGYESGTHSCTPWGMGGIPLCTPWGMEGIPYVHPGIPYVHPGRYTLCTPSYVHPGRYTPVYTPSTTLGTPVHTTVSYVLPARQRWLRRCPEVEPWAQGGDSPGWRRFTVLKSLILLRLVGSSAQGYSGSPARMDERLDRRRVSSPCFPIG